MNSAFTIMSKQKSSKKDSKPEPEPPSPETIKENVKQLKEWMAKEPHLPNIDDDKWFEIFLRNTKYRMEKAKTKLDNYYSLRNKYPNLLKNRDPTSPELQKQREAVTIALSDRLTNDGYRLIYHRYEPDPKLLNGADYYKRMIMTKDVLLLEGCPFEGCLFIADCRSLRYAHFLKLMMWIRELVAITEGGYAARVKACHVISSSNLIYRMVDFTKRFLPKKVADRMHVHSATNPKVFETIDNEVLSSEYGGKGPSLAESEEYTEQLLLKYKDWFIEQENVTSNELLRQKKGKPSKKVDNSFKRLELD